MYLYYYYGVIMYLQFLDVVKFNKKMHSKLFTCEQYNDFIMIIIIIMLFGILR